ncbi:hypothetical protein BAE44_0007752, partial [Dichanthelium oligosanthes]
RPSSGSRGIRPWPPEPRRGRPGARPERGGQGRALWTWIGRGRRNMVVLGRSGSLVNEQQYGHEEYAQNFDEGAAAGEPENLSWSFSMNGLNGAILLS